VAVSLIIRIHLENFRITEKEREHLKRIEQRLDTVITQFGSGGAFVRMDTRSPKDAILTGSAVKKELKEEIQRRPHSDVHSNECMIDDTITYWRSISKAQCVFSGKDAMDLLLRSNRISDDIARGKLAQGDSFKTQLVVRKWADIEPELEFRVFVVRGEITAITQYHKKCYVPTIKNNKHHIQQQIISKFNELKSFVNAPDNTYTIDFAVDKNLSALMIEVNDPPPTAGTSLFDWENENDKKILREGPFTFRILEENVPWKDQDDLAGNLKIFIDELRGRMRVEEEQDGSGEKNSKCALQ